MPHPACLHPPAPKSWYTPPACLPPAHPLPAPSILPPPPTLWRLPPFPPASVPPPIAAPSFLPAGGPAAITATPACLRYCHPCMRALPPLHACTTATPACVLADYVGTRCWPWSWPWLLPPGLADRRQHAWCNPTFSFQASAATGCRLSPQPTACPPGPEASPGCRYIEHTPPGCRHSARPHTCLWAYVRCQDSGS